MLVTFCDTCDDFVTPQVFQLLELPAETEKLETHQALLVTRRAILLQSIYNSSSEPGDNITAFKEVITDIWMRTKHARHPQEVSEALDRYEEACSEASSAGVDIVSKDFTNNWDYIQSCFFALTILTTIGMNTSCHYSGVVG